MVVYDITSQRTYEAVEEIRKDVENYSPENSIVYVVGNKCDMESKREIQQEQAQTMATKNNF
jgi:GTPase SAR1 family protein